MPDQPNVILIEVDQWRGDCLSVAGHPVVRTPYLDQLALEGARFERAYAACPSCLPSRASLYTGLTQRSHGRVGYQDGVPWNYPVTIASEFTHHGYQTQAVGKMHVYPERSQLGFQNVILHDGYLHFARRENRNLDMVDDYGPWLRAQLGRDADELDDGIDCNSYVARPWDKPEHVHPTNFVAAQSIDFLRRRDPRKPFFLFMSFHRPHAPYDPPAWAFDQYIDAPMPPPPAGDWSDLYARWAAPFRPDTQVGNVPPDTLRRALAGYYGLITQIDHQVHRFLSVLHEYKLDANTWVCFVSDHGDMLGDHGLFRKCLPYEGSARVPLILKGPKDSGIVPGTVDRHPVEMRDIMPTLLECAGLPVPDSVEGRSVLPFARGEAPAWREYLHGEHPFHNVSIQWITDGRMKYVWFSDTGAEQLFNLDDDPQELHDLARAGADVTPWRQRLIGELSGREEGFTDGESLVTGRPVIPTLEHERRRAGIASVTTGA